MNATRYRRRNYFINKEYQGRTIFHYFLLILAGSILFSLVFSFFSSNTISIVYEDYHLKLGTTPGILMDRIFSAQWFFIVVCGMAVILITLFLTHRVAGPFYRFEKSLDTMLEKDISGNIHLRKKDEGKGVAERLNRFNTMLATHLSAVEAANKEIRQLAEEQNNPDPEVLESISEKSRRIDALINEFTFTRQ
ncbi:MAG: methyl-accepting chemotaxis protein [Desulfobacteraceae bacterium]|nr:methyl-accepting chemotaxis protein [Desulfobacteraceae bacterium]